MLQATIIQHNLIFKQASGTSRGVLHQKPSWYIKIFHVKKPRIFGLGECSIIPGLSPDNINNLDSFLKDLAKNINFYVENPDKLTEWPSVQFGVETAMIDLKNGGKKLLFPSEFTDGNEPININGLIWMGPKEFMRTQIKEKIDSGYNCIKLKIGALNFEEEIEILREIRKNYSPETIELRLDANGAFHSDEALEKLNRLSEFYIHSIEQPIKVGQIEEMAKLCKLSPIEIALDEELIGVWNKELKHQLLESIKPHYIILKPSLLGGIKKSEEGIKIAEDCKVGWWVTSALESNIGLNAIAQWAYQLNSSLPQGLGTGKLFENNISSPLIIKNAKLYHDPEMVWDLNAISQ